MGLQQYNGISYNSCRLTEAPLINDHEWPSDLSFGRPCSINLQGNFQCPEELFCRNIEQYRNISLESEHLEQRAYLNYGITNFDHLGTALLTVFEMITSETWYQQLMNLMDVDFPVIGAVYCFLVIIVGQFFLLNLILAVIIESFMRQHELELQEEIQALKNEDADSLAYYEEDLDYYDEEEAPVEEQEEDEESEFESASSFSDGEQEAKQGLVVEAVDEEEKKEDDKHSDRGDDAFDEEFSRERLGISQMKHLRYKDVNILAKSNTRRSKKIFKQNTQEMHPKNEDNTEGTEEAKQQFYQGKTSSLIKSQTIQQKKLKRIGGGPTKLKNKRQSFNMNLTKTQNIVKQPTNHLSQLTQQKNGSFKIPKNKRMSKKFSETTQINGLQKLGNQLQQSQQSIEEQRKYDEGEDFLSFIRPHAQKRRIANMFFKIKEIQQQQSVEDMTNNKLGDSTQDQLKEENKHAPKDDDETDQFQPSKQVIEKYDKDIEALSEDSHHLQKGAEPILTMINEEDNSAAENSVSQSVQEDNNFDPFSVEASHCSQSKRNKKQTKQSNEVTYSSGINKAMLLSRIKKEINRELSIKQTKAAFKSAIMINNKDNSLNTLVVANKKLLKKHLTYRRPIRPINLNKDSFRSLKFYQSGVSRHSQSEKLHRAISEKFQSVKQVDKTSQIFNLIQKKLNFTIKKQFQEIQDLQRTTSQHAFDRKNKNRCIYFSSTIADSPIFQAFILLVNFIIIIVLAMDHYPINKNQIYGIEIVNIGYEIIIVFELIIKLIAYGLKNHFMNQRFNQFDTFIIILSLIDLVTSIYLLQKDLYINSALITVLRGFRILRIFKFARYWRNFQILIETIGATLVNTTSFTLLLFFTMFSYVIIGLLLFANKSKIMLSENGAPPKESSPQFNFDTFTQSFLTTYLILTNDGQSVIYYNFYRTVSPVAATIFWTTFVVLIQKIFVNVFIALLLQNYNEGSMKMKLIEQEMERQINIQMNDAEGDMSLLAMIKEYMNEQLQRVWRLLERSKNTTEMEFKKKGSKRDIEKQSTYASASKGSKNIKNLLHTKKMYDIKIQGNSLGFLPKNSYLRKKLHSILVHKRYNLFIVICILISAISLALNSPILDPDSHYKMILYWVDVSIIIIFTLECIIKIIVQGFLFNGEESYLRGMWNFLDFIILIFSYVCLTPLEDTFKFIKTFRILRALRLVGRNEGLKVAVRALFYAIPFVLNITVIMLLFFSVFAVISVSYFKGKLYYCTPNIQVIGSVNYKWDCLNAGGEWINRTYNFDNIINAFVMLFVFSTTAGWGDIMTQTITSTDIDQVPGHLRPVEWITFYSIFMIVGCFFFLNLFVGVVIQTFKQQQEIVGGSELLTDKQKEWIDLRLLVLRSAPIKKLKAPENKFRAVCFYIQSHKHFEKFIQLCIISNTIVLMIKWYRQSQAVYDATELLNYIFASVFLFEAFLRIAGIGFKHYFQDGWNIFDFSIAVGSLIAIIISLNTSVSFKATTLLRAFRILRLLRLLKRGGKSLYLIFNTFVISMQSLANIGSLLLLIMYIYSLIGMIYFGEVKWIGSMNYYINFQAFWNSFITLFTVLTADSWNYTMASFTHSKSPSYNCIENPNYQDYVNNGYQTVGCGNDTSAFAFFVSFMFIVSLIFLKLFIAIILEGYNQTIVQDSRLFNNDMKEKFREVWSEYDPDATTFMKLADLRHFLFSLGQPLGFDESFVKSKLLQDRFIASLELPTYQNFQSYQFLDVLDALSFRLMVLEHINKIQAPNEEIKELKQEQAPDEKTVKNKLEKEVNRLIFQKQSENIVAFKELWEKEQKKQKYREVNKDKTGLTSSHHMALEAAIRRIKVILAKRRKERNPSDIGKIEPITEPEIKKKQTMFERLFRREVQPEKLQRKLSH